MWLEELESPALKWTDLRRMLDEIGEVTEEPYGIVRVTRKGQSLSLRSLAGGAALPAAQLARVRQFIERTRSATPQVSRAGEWLVVIDRFEASVFRSLSADAMPQLIRSRPSDGEVGARRAAGKRGGAGGETVSPGFFEPLVGVLHCARRILIMGRETTLGGEAERFVGWLRGYRPAVAERIVGSIAVEPHEFTEAGLVAKARDFYAKLNGRCAVDRGRGSDGATPAG